MALGHGTERAIDAAISSMDAAAKATLTAGAGIWSSAVDATLGLRTMWVSDGPNGVRGRSFDDRDPSYCTPSGSALAATWDAAMVQRVGELVGRDARRKELDVVLGPTVNLHRSPLGGRGFECYSEDPLLTTEIAVAWVAGVQSQGVAATAKHFVANESETSRMTADMVVDERALRELYLVPFEALAAAGVWAIMTAYNKVNGTYASEHGKLVGELLKEEWGWDGLVMSDWFGTNDTNRCATGGLDLEMPGPGRFFGPALASAIAEGAFDESVLDDKVRRLARLAYRVGALEGSPTRPAFVDPGDTNERLVLREAAASGMVLLRNEGQLLPLDPSELKRVAVIGPHATRPAYQGGGSAQLGLDPTVIPLDAIRDALDGVEVLHEVGCTAGTTLPLVDALPTYPVHSESAHHGLSVEYYDNMACTGSPRHVEPRRSGRLVWLTDFPLQEEGLSAAGVRMRGTFETGTEAAYEFSVRGCGEIRLVIDHDEVSHQPYRDYRSDPAALLNSADHVTDMVILGSGTHTIEVTAGFDLGPFMLIEVCGRECLPVDGIARAVQAASDADVAIVLVGNTEEQETETKDRTSLSLPGDQARLVEAVTAANPRTVVVVHAGMPVDLGCARGASALLYGWFAGQEVGPALADVLTGEREPGGRLPFTIGERLEDYAAASTQPDAANQLHYDESVFVGYRHFDTQKIEPVFAFGHGLGYGNFAYGDLVVEETHCGEAAHASVVVTNVGPSRAKEVVQLYLSELAPYVPRPSQELAALAVVHLEPGESLEVDLVLASRAFSTWDVNTHSWVEREGVFRAAVGRSSRDLRSSVELVRVRRAIGHGAAEQATP
jgi:beta-glucosidase